MTKKRTRTPLDEFEGYQKKLFRKGHSLQKTQGGHFGLGSKELILKKNVKKNNVRVFDQNTKKYITIPTKSNEDHFVTNVKMRKF